MAKNTGIPYEILTKSIFESLLKQDAVKTKRLEHNVTLKGKTTEHQIDVYWEFEAGGTTYYTVVQAKDWGQPVAQGHLLTFKGVLDDLTIRATGIMVTRTGYQEGAENVAKGYGILLYELREIRDVDWIGKIKTICLRLSVLLPKISNVELISDDTWVQAQKTTHGVPANEPIEVYGSAGEISLTDVSGAAVGTMADVLNQYIPAELKPGMVKVIDHKFDPAVYVATRHPKITRLALSRFKCNLEVDAQTEEFKFGGEDFAHFILKNTLDDTARLFSKERTLVK